MIPVTVTFYGDVGFDRSYNHVIDFSNETQRESYFTPKILKTISDCAYNKPMNSIQIRCNYEEALSFTYCKFIMGSNSSHQKKIFAWVDDVILKTDQKDENGNYLPILEVNIAIDPWQTFLFDFTLGESFVAREHVDRFSANGDGTRGWCLPNSSDNNSVGIEKRSLISKFRKGIGLFDTAYFWIVIQYIVRNQTTNNDETKIILVPVMNGICHMDSVDYRILTFSSLVEDNYITILGLTPDKVVSSYFIPYNIINLSPLQNAGYYELSYPTNYVNTYGLLKRKYGDYVVYELGSYTTKGEISADYIFDNSVGLTVPQNNDSYSPNHEPQLFKKPYKHIGFIDSNGIEQGSLPDISSNIVNGFNGVKIRLLIDTVEVRVRIIPLYNSTIELDSKYWTEFVLPSIDVIRDNWINYLMQERETARQMLSSQVSQQAIASAINGVSSATSLGGQQAMSVGKAQTGQSELGAFGAGATIGLGVGAIQTIGGYVANKHFAFEQQDIREKAVKRKASTLAITGTFKSLIQDLTAVLVTCDETTFNLKALEFHKYGYSIFAYKTPNTKTRKYFNFIATDIVKIEGSLNNNIKMALMEIFNNGVTIWHGDYISELTGIGDYSKENIERSLL